MPYQQHWSIADEVYGTLCWLSF